MGFDNIIGYLKGGMEAWKKEGFKVDTIDLLTTEEFAKTHKSSNVIDVRVEQQYEEKHVKDATNFVLYNLTDTFDVKKDENYSVYCVTGYLSMIMASILKRKGAKKVSDLTYGFEHLMKDLKKNKKLAKKLVEWYYLL